MLKPSKELHPYALSSEKPGKICEWEYPRYSMVPLCVLHDSELIHIDIRVYGHLRARCIDKPFTWVSQKTIAICNLMFGIPSTTGFDQFRRWKASGLFEELPRLRVQCHRGSHDIDWTWIKMFDRFKTNLEPERDQESPPSKEDEKIYRTVNFTARGTPRKNQIQARILRKVREHFHEPA